MIKDTMTSDIWSRTKPLRSKNLIISRGLTAGSFGILEVQGGNQRLVVRRDWLLVLFQALDIPGYGVFRHFLGFCERSAKRHTSRKSRHDGCEPAFRFGPKDNIEVAVCFLHLLLPILSPSPSPRQLRSSQSPLIIS